MNLSLGPTDALLVIDVQNDFLPGGALAVPAGDAVIEPINLYLDAFSALRGSIVATRDWHPAEHSSFAEQGGIWPPHCVQETDGAALSARLRLPPGTPVVSKGTAVEVDAYSGFAGTDLDERLRAAGVERVFVGGLATDYCVLNTVRDALELGYTTHVLLDAIRAVDVKVGDGDRAIAEILEKGAIATRLEDL